MEIESNDMTFISLMIVVAICVVGFFGTMMYMQKNSTQIEIIKYQYKIDSLKAIGGK